jgi:Mg2+ and Co2+ transporter CorA
MCENDRLRAEVRFLKNSPRAEDAQMMTKSAQRIVALGDKVAYLKECLTSQEKTIGRLRHERNAAEDRLMIERHSRPERNQVQKSAAEWVDEIGRLRGELKKAKAVIDRQNLKMNCLRDTIQEANDAFSIGNTYKAVKILRNAKL